MTPQIIQKIIIVLVVLLGLGYLGYTVFIEAPVPEQDSVSGLIKSQDNSVIGRNIITLADKLKTVSIDESFFSSPLLTTLKDVSIPLIQEAQGRINPFAPLGSDISVSGQSQTTGGTR